MEEQEKQAIEEKLKIESQFKSGANWFFWIAGLSVINSIIFLAGGGRGFIIGLGITQIIDSIGLQIAAESGNTGYIMAFILDIIVAGVFVLFGVFARKRHRWAFIIGMILYALDGLLFLMIKDYLSIGFHIFALFFISGGLKASNRLNQISNQPFGLPAEIDNPGPIADDWLQGQEKRELRRQMLRDLQDPCPYCKFNLKSGKEKCEECGKLFYAPESGV